MQKIVINNCHGGFGLSMKAQLELYNLGSPIIEAFEPEKYYGEDLWQEKYERDIKIMKDKEDGVEHIALFGTVIAPDGKILSVERGDHQHRTCPHLIKMVEEDPEGTAGRYAELKVVEIPDDVKWTIEEYDGWEHVAEKHRVWHAE